MSATPPPCTSPQGAIRRRHSRRGPIASKEFTVGLYLGSCGVLGGGAFSYERGTPVPTPTPTGLSPQHVLDVDRLPGVHGPASGDIIPPGDIIPYPV
jgi:hypothetical protein